MYDKVAFLNEFFKIHECRIEILDFLISEKCITNDQKQRLLTDPKLTHTSSIAQIIADSIESENLQSAEYTWTILPHKTMKLSLIGNLDALEINGI